MAVQLRLSGALLSPDCSVCRLGPRYPGVLWDSLPPLGMNLGFRRWVVAAPGHPLRSVPWLIRLPLFTGADVLSFLGRLQAGLPPYSPVFKSWIHCWKYLSVQVGKAPNRGGSPHSSPMSIR